MRMRNIDDSPHQHTFFMGSSMEKELLLLSPTEHSIECMCLCMYTYIVYYATPNHLE